MDNALLKEITAKVGGKTSIFLGAGASAYLGLPTMMSFLKSAYGDDFVDKIQNSFPYAINTDSVNQKATNEKGMTLRLFHSAGLDAGRPSLDLEEIFEFIHRTNILHSQRDKDVIKKLLYLFKNCSEGGIQHFPQYHANFKANSQLIDRWMDEFLGAISNLRKKMHESFLIDTGNTVVLDKLKKSYGLLKVLCEMSDAITIFTTNFDTTFEALGIAGGSFNLVDGFTGRYPTFDFKNFSNSPNKTNSVYYFKLHGSVTWRRESDGKIKDSFPSVPNSVAILEPVLSKKPEELPFTDMYEVFEEVLKENEQCIFIGFSFRDDTVRRMIESRLTSPKPFRLFIIAPEDKSSPQLNEHIVKLAKNSKVHWIKEYWGEDAAKAVLTVML